MRKMTNRERILAVVQRREHDRVPFVQYSGIAAPNEQVWELVGREHLGVLRWCGVHRVEHPHCRTEVEEFERDGRRGQRSTLITPAGSLWEERFFEPVYGSSSASRHYVQEPADYEILNAYLRDGVVIENREALAQAEKELGEDGLPLVAVERTAYQQLWVQWAGLENLSAHRADCPDRVEETVGLLNQRQRQIFEIVSKAPLHFVDFPDNITAPAIGPDLFRRYCVPLYNELADMLSDRDVPVFVHMDGDLRPLWGAIGDSSVGGIDSMSPPPDNDTSVAEAIEQWPEMRLFVNYPSSVHLLPHQAVYDCAMGILTEGGREGRVQIQISENVPRDVWRTSFPAIAQAITDFGPPCS